MTAMQIFERCRALEGDKRALSDRIARYRESATRMGAALGGAGVRGSAGSDKLAAILGEIDEIERAIARRERQYSAELAAACKLLDMLPEPGCKIIDRYYIGGEPLTAIARGLSYSYGYVRTIKSAACARLEGIPEGCVAELLPEWYLQELHP